MNLHDQLVEAIMRGWTDPEILEAIQAPLHMITFYRQAFGLAAAEDDRWLEQIHSSIFSDRSYEQGYTDALNDCIRNGTGWAQDLLDRREDPE